MKFNRILEQYVKESEALTKVMLKVDPKDSSNVDFRHFDGYEGYILKESDGLWSVLFENLDLPVAEVPFSIIKITKVPSQDLTKIKIFGLKAIEERRGLTMELINKIQHCESIDFLEQFLKEEGLTDSEIKDIYKHALLDESIVEENIISTIAKNAGKEIGSAVGAVKNQIKSGIDYAKQNPLKAAGKTLLGAAGLALAPDYAIAGGIKKAAKGIENQLGQGKNNYTTQAQSTGVATPPPDVIAAVNTATPISLQINVPDHGSTQFVKIFQQGPPTNFKHYKIANQPFDFYHNVRTGDVIKIAPDPTNYTNAKVSFGNTRGSPIDPNKVPTYLNNQFKNELSYDKVFFINYSFSTLPPSSP